MKYRLILVVALLSVLLPLAVPQAQAQTGGEVTLEAWVVDSADVVVTGVVVSSEVLETDGTPYTVSRVQVNETFKGSVDGEILVATPGGTAASGLTLVVSHAPKIGIGDEVQLGLVDSQTSLPTSSLALFEIHGGQAGAVVLVSGGAPADFVSNMRWRASDFPLEYRVNPNGSNLSANAALVGMRAGFDRWENINGSSIDFTYRGTTNFVGPRANQAGRSDGQNTISFGGIFPQPNPTTGIAYLWFSGSTIVEFDIVMESARTWSNRAVTGADHLETVVSHEVGHALGFGHVPDRRSVMHETLTTGRVRNFIADDLLGARTIYPGPTTPRPTPTPTTPPANTTQAVAFSQNNLRGSSQSGERFGTAIASGDFNNDGRDDFVIGSPGEAGSRGQVTVVYGNNSGSANFSPGAVGGDLFGSAVEVGDFNADGFDDVAVGSPGKAVRNRARAGGVTVLYGGGGGISASGFDFFSQDSPGMPGSAEVNDQFGFSLAAGDFNGDGRDDLAVGAPGEGIFNRARAGGVAVLYSDAGGVASANGRYFHQSQRGLRGAAEPGDEFGFSLAAGNFNGDGFDDLVAGSPGEDFRFPQNVGVIHMMLGSTNGITLSGSKFLSQSTPGVPNGSEDNDRFGHTLVAGDFNGDGRDDIAVSAPDETFGVRRNAGMVWSLFGSSTGLTGTGSQNFTQRTAGLGNGVEQSDRFGVGLAAGDINGDGNDDLVVGVPDETLGRAGRTGLVHVINGSPSGLTGSGSATYNQSSTGIPDRSEANDAFGSAVAVGDFDGNGRGDIMIGVPGENARAGAVTVVFE